MKNVKLTRVLLPTRFAILSRRAAEYARIIAPKFAATVHVVHVIPHIELLIDPHLPGAAMPLPGPAPSELLNDAERKLTAFVHEVLPDIEGNTTTFAVIGAIADELVRYAADHHIDLIIMGTHAEGMLKRMIHGSVGKNVLEHSPCPVLLVPVRDAAN
jgi:nucleotide-binding universal stress UspA family protein